MMRVFYIITCLLALAVAAGAADRFKVKYVSAENVYLDGGEADGLAVGARLTVFGASGAKAEIEVVYVAAHSASCKVIGEPANILAGDKAHVVSSSPSDTLLSSDSTTPVVEVKDSLPKIIDTRRRSTISPLSGNLSVVYHRWNDNTASDLDFTQTTARVSLTARRLWGREITFAVRGRGRLDQRRREYRSTVRQEDWQNRLWEFSLSYEETTAPINIYAGRILPRRAGGIGYLDGLLMEGLLSDHVRIGLFAGSYPGWLYDERQLSLAKTGGYIGFTSGTYGGFYAEENIGAAGEYHQSDVNREYLFIQGRLSRGRVWGLSHTGEIEIYRSWRKEQTGRSLELSNLFINGWVRPITHIRFALSYDNRTNYRTFDTRSLVDSLFDDHLRQGVRVQTDLTLPAQIFTSASAGYRKRAGDPDPSWSYSGHLRKGNLLIEGLALSAQYAAFDNSANHGYNYSFRADYFLRGAYMLGAAYGRYAYRADGLLMQRTNDWIEFSGQADVGRHWWIGTRFQTDSGDDIAGNRIQSELGYRF